MNNILVLLLLVYAHCMGDMVFQTEFMARLKRKHMLAMIQHCFVWTGTVMLMLTAAKWDVVDLWHIPFLFFGHWAIDHWKSRKPADDEHFWCMYVDQGLHMVQLFVVWL